MLFSKIKLLLAVVFLLPSFARAEKSDFETTGDILQIALPLTALLATYPKSQSENKQWKYYFYPLLKSYSSGLVTVHVGKNLFNKSRPNGDNRRSFPSGHTFSAFSGAAYLSSLYGYKGAIPAYIVATAAGLSRIDAKQHFADDVLAGASIALLYNWYFMDKLSHSRQGIKPLIIAGSESTLLGIQGSTESLGVTSNLAKYRAVVSYNFGLLTPERTEMLHGSTHLFDVSSLIGNEGDVATSHWTFDFPITSSSIISVNFSPLGVYQESLLKKTMIFKGKSFSSGESVASRWIQYDLDLKYSGQYSLSRSFDLLAGGGIYLHHSRLNIESIGRSLEAHDSFWGYIPFVELGALMKATDQWSFSMKVATHPGDIGSYTKYSFSTDYRFSNRWGLILAYTDFSRKIDLEKKGIISPSDINYNKISQKIISLGIKYYLF